ncbi:hypothetical protein MCEGEM3_00482 [Oxalobacteraceae bacterium]
MNIRKRLGLGFISSALARLLITPRQFLQFGHRNTELSTAERTDLDSYATWHKSYSSCNADSQGDKVFLILSLMPLSYCLKMEGLVAKAMQQRGYRVVVVTNLECQSLVEHYHVQLNGLETLVIEDFLSILSLRHILSVFRGFFSNSEKLIEDTKKFQYCGSNIGLNSLATLSAKADVGLGGLNLSSKIELKRILLRSVFLLDSANRLMKLLKPMKALSMEKGFVGTCELFHAAINNQIPFVQWIGCHEPNSIMFKKYSKGNVREHPFSISSGQWDEIKEMSWSENYADKVMQQFKRGYSEGQWFLYKNLTTNQKELDRENLIKKLGLNPELKTAIIYSHILNDANLFYGEDLFGGGFKEWLVETVRMAARNPNVNWVLKLHPANIGRKNNFQKTGKYGELLALESAFGKIPDFLTVVYPDEATSPLSFFSITDFGITVRGTVGMELPCFGTPTLTAGTGRYSGRGFTVDSLSRDDYFHKLLNIHKIPRLSSEQIKLGQRYAYFVFRVRPARYGDMFVDEHIVSGNARRRDLKFDGISASNIFEHKQMRNITDFLCSSEEDFLDFDYV